MLLKIDLNVSHVPPPVTALDSPPLCRSDEGSGAHDLDFHAGIRCRNERFSFECKAAWLEWASATMATMPHVLVVDDEEPTTLSFARMLRLEGYDVETALDGETGLRMAGERVFDAILLD